MKTKHNFSVVDNTSLLTLCKHLSQASAHEHTAQANEWIEAADFVGYIVFFVAIFFVLHAFYIMFLAITVTHRYAVLDKATIGDILLEFEMAQSKWWNRCLMRFRMIPLLTVLKNVEFKIGWAVFRDTYMLPSQFSYVEYVSGCLQRYALRLTDINITSWFFLIALAVLNFLRMILLDRDCVGGIPVEDREGNDEVQKRLEKCEDEHRLLFLVCGGFLVLYVVGLYLVGRIYQFRIIGRVGVLGVDDYADFLIFEEAQLVKDEQKKLKVQKKVEEVKDVEVEEGKGNLMKRRSSVVVFKNAMNSFIVKQQRQEQQRNSHQLWFNKLSAKFRPIHIQPEKNNDESQDMLGSKSSFVKSSQNSKSSGSKGFFKLFSKSNGAANKLPMKDDDVKISPGARAIINQWQSPARRFYIKLKERTKPKAAARLDKLIGREKRIKFSEDLSEIFFMNSARLFFKSVELAILMNCLFLAVWFCNYMTRMGEDFEKNYLMIVPIIVCFPVIGEIVKIASLIDCTAALNLDIVGQIIEDIEERVQLKKSIQDKLKLLPLSEDECMATVNRLFTEAASPRNPNEIRYEDFRDILKSLKIYFR